MKKIILLGAVMMTGLGIASTYANNVEEIVNSFNPQNLEEPNEFKTLGQAKSYLVEYIRTVDRNVKQELYSDDYKKAKQMVLTDSADALNNLINNPITRLGSNLEYIVTIYYNYYNTDNQIKRIISKINNAKSFNELDNILMESDINMRMDFGSYLKMLYENLYENLYEINLVKYLQKNQK